MILNLDCRHGLAMLPDNSVDAILTDPPGGTLLDLFAGSGSFGISAKMEGFGFVGFEKDPTSADCANRRYCECP